MSEPVFTIGGSDAAAACGLDPFRSRIMLWAEKTGRYERETTEAMEWGSRLEAVVIGALLEQGLGPFTAVPGYADPERLWLQGHPDRIGGPKDDTVVEVKTSGQWGAHEWNGNGAPARYVIQCQHYLHLTGLDRALLAVLIAGQRLETRIVERDDALIAAMIEAEAETYDYLVRDVPPPPDGSDSAAEVIRALHPEAVSGKTARLSKAGMVAVNDAKLFGEAERRNKERKEQALQVLKLEAGDAEILVSPGDAEVAKWVNVESSRIDTTRLRKEAPHVAAQYSVTTSTRRFTLA